MEIYLKRPLGNKGLFFNIIYYMSKSWLYHSGDELWANFFYGTPLPKRYRDISTKTEWDENIPYMEMDLKEGEEWEALEGAENFIITSKARIYNLQKKKWLKSIKSYQSLTRVLRINKKSVHINISDFIEENFGIVYDANNLPDDVRPYILYANEKNKYKKAKK